MDAQLIGQLEARATLVTPNRRLARDLARRFDRAQAAAGRSAWRSADILSWEAWIVRALRAVALDDATLQLPDAMQELALWRRVVEGACASPLLDAGAAARTARDARALQLGWHIDCAGAHSEEVAAYVEWVRRFESACRKHGWTEPARRLDVLATHARAHGLSGCTALILYGFDQLSVQERALLEACRAGGAEVSERAPVRMTATVRRIACGDEEDERRRVAAAVREALLAQPHARIGIVVPALAATRDAWMRALDDALQPARCLPGRDAGARPYNLSLGRPLAALPLVHAALTLLRLAQGSAPLVEIGVLLRGPFIAGAEQERAQRAQLDAQLRRHGAREVSLETLLEVARGRSPQDPAACRVLAGRLQEWLPRAAVARARRQLPSAWSVVILDLCAALGWPGERGLDSDEFQAQRKFQEAVSGLGRLDAVLNRIAYSEALTWLARSAADTLFQPESPEVPVHVVGTLESVGLEFDQLYVTGLHDEVWPEAPRPNPFLPVVRQRAAGVPHASAEWELAFAQRMLEHWTGAAGSVWLSHPTRQGDRPLRASALLQDIPVGEAAVPAAGLALRMLRARRMEEVADGRASPLEAGFEVPGGVAVLENQAACAFRAFVVHRLGARELEEPHAGLDARERGTLLHRALALLWGHVQSHAGLLALDAPQRAAVIGASVDAAIESLRGTRADVLTETFTALERARLMELLGQLLELEQTRAPFVVVEREAPRAIDFDGLRLRARVDRVDELADGRRVVIDYKTGASTVADWLGERPDAPQLPLYALTDPGEVAALAYASVRAGSVGFVGLAADALLLPGLQSVQQDRTGAADFPAMLAAWRVHLGALAAEFLAGHAAVAPKNYPQTCRYCALGSVCRVTELFDRGPVNAGDNGDDE
jgi:probable DNA repair protein